ncbi:MAG: hypothetical protein KatS3mg077_2874 [Candidatus Binatia bacterium]|nr:MAG: hypothetical protein KatS3mg077_2874 [Candidatus Binatia bacterium]
MFSGQRRSDSKPTALAALSLLFVVEIGSAQSNNESQPSPSTFTGLASGPNVALNVGAATTSIPIAVPTGHRNITPRLALRYSSGGGAGPYGVGWTLPLARIERDSRFGAPGCPNPGEAGARFVLSTPEGSIPCKLVDTTTGHCRPEVEGSFLRIRYIASSNSWEVREKNGIVHRFGEVPSARLFNGDPLGLFDVRAFRYAGDPGTIGSRCTWTAAWAVTSTSDPNGNLVEFSYYPDFRPMLVQWGANGATGHAYRVQFLWEAPQQTGQTVTVSIGGMAVTYQHRLKKIVVEAMNPVAPIRSYTFYYAGERVDDQTVLPPSAGRGWILRTVQLAGADGGVLLRADGAPANTVFHYLSHRLATAENAGNESSFGFAPVTASLNSAASFTSVQERIGGGAGPEVWLTTADLLDMNGDALPDAVRVVRDGAGNCIWQVNYGISGSAEGWAVPGNLCAIREERSERRSDGSQKRTLLKTTLDINGDAIPDFVDGTTSPWSVWLGYAPTANSTGGFLSPIPWMNSSYTLSFCSGNGCEYELVLGLGETTASGESEYSTTPLMDMNGDGLLDHFSPQSQGPYLAGQEQEWLAHVQLGIGGCTLARVQANDLSGCGFQAPRIETHPTGIRYTVPTFPVPAVLHSSRVRRLPRYNQGGEILDRSGFVVQDMRDMTGDRLPDIVVYCGPESWTACPDGGSGFLVYKNLGYRFAMDAEYWPAADIPCGLPSTDHYTLFGLQAVTPGREKPDKIGRDLVDINGDGLLDLVSACDRSQPFYFGSTAYPDDWIVQVNHGSGFVLGNNGAPRLFRWRAGARDAIRQYKMDDSWKVITYRDVIDVNGDGLADLLEHGNFDPGERRFNANCSINGQASFCPVFAAHVDPANNDTRVRDAGKPGDLLVAIENGIGGTDVIAYAVLATSAVPYPLWVVSSITRSNGLCTGNFPWYDCGSNGSPFHQLVTAFQYQGALFERNDREFRGFRTVVQTDGRTKKTTLYYQDAVRKGLIQEVVREPEPGKIGTIEKSEDTWDCADITDRRPSEVGPPSGNPSACPAYLSGSERRWWVRLASSSQSSCPTGGARCADPLARTTWQLNDTWDDYGNITKLGKTESGATGDVLEFTSFLHTDHESMYLVDKPRESYSMWLGAVLERKWFDYDTRGNPIRVYSWLNTNATGSQAGVPCPNTQVGGSCTVIEMVYDRFGNLISTTDPLGRVSTTTFDSAGLFPIETQNALNQRVSYSYDRKCGALLSRSAPYSGSTPPPDWPQESYTYDQFCRLKTVQLPGQSRPDQTIRYYLGYAGTATRAPYPTAIRVFKSSISGAYFGVYDVLDQFWDGLGRPLQKKHTAAVARSDRTRNATMTVVSDTLKYNAFGEVSQKLAPFTEEIPQDGFASRPTFTRPPIGLDGWSYDYDGLGRLNRVQAPDDTARTFSRSVPWRVDSWNQCSIMNRGTLYPACSGGAMRVQEIFDGSGRVIEKIQFDESGNFQARTIYRYDGLGRQISMAQADSPIENPDTGPTVTRTRITTQYDSLGRKIRVTDPDSGVWQYGYDLAGNLIVQDDPKTGQSLRFRYDGLNRVTEKLVLATDSVTCSAGAAGCPVERRIGYLYDRPAAGLVSCEAASCPKGDCALGRLSAIEERYPSGGATGSNWIAYCYDIAGRQRQIRERITVSGSSDGPLEAEMRFVHDPESGALTDMVYPDGEVVHYSYANGMAIAADGTLSGVSKIYVQNLLYDLFGRPLQLDHGRTVAGADVRDEWEYYGPERNFRLKALRTLRVGTSTETLQGLAYEYEADGGIKAITDGVFASSDGRYNGANFRYDALGRLSEVSASRMNGSYAFSTIQNLMAKEGRTFTYGNPNTPHQPSAFGGQTVAHDGNGNRTRWAGWEYVYDKEDRLVAVNQGGTRQVEFVWGPAGNRVAKRVPGAAPTYYVGAWMEVSPRFVTKYVYIGSRLVAARRAWRVGDEPFWAHGPKLWEFAGSQGGEPRLVIRLTGVGARVVSWGLVVATVAVLLSPQRRRSVVGMRPRAGSVAALVVVVVFGGGPIPVLVMPAWAGGGGGGNPPPPPPGADTIGVMHFHLDHLGSTQMLTREDGSVFRYVRYTAYGQVRGSYSATGGSASGCSDHEFCREFTGYDSEPRTGLAFAPLRVYQPELGMFLTHDPARQFASPYAYGPWDPVNGTDPTGAVFGLDDLVAWAVVLLAAAVAIDVGVRTGDVGAALKAGALTFVSGVATAVGAYAGLGVLAAHVSASTIAIVSNVLAAGLASGAYGAVEAGRNGMYASAAVGAILLAAGAYRLLKGWSAAGGEWAVDAQRQSETPSAAPPAHPGTVQSGEPIADPAVKRALRSAWKDSNPGVAPPPGESPASPLPREQGGWIRRRGNLLTRLLLGEYYVERWPAGAQASIVPTTQPPDAVGSFHTHPNLGPAWVASASPADYRWFMGLTPRTPHYIVAGPGVYRLNPDGTQDFLGPREAVIGR